MASAKLNAIQPLMNDSRHLLIGCGGWEHDQAAVMGKMVDREGEEEERAPKKKKRKKTKKQR